MTTKRVPCENCGNMVARTSRLCPVCRSQKPNSFRNTLGTLGIVAFVGWLGISAVIGHPGNTSVPASTNAFVETNNAATGTSDDLNGVANESETGTPPPPTDAASAGDDARLEEGDSVSGHAGRTVPESTSADVVARSIALALNEDSNQQWSDGARSAVIEIKHANALGQRGCRKYRLVEGSHVSDWTRKCRGGDGQWTAAD